MKRCLLGLLLVMFLLGCAEARELKADNFIFGSSYSNYVYKYYLNGEVNPRIDFIREDLHYGYGYYGEYVYQLNDRVEIGIGISQDKMKASWQMGIGFVDYGYQIDLNKYYGKLNYRLSPKSIIYVNSGYSIYKEILEQEEKSYIVRKGNGWGVEFGTEIECSINQGMQLLLNSGFKLINIDVNENYLSYSGISEKVRLSGLQLGVAVSYRF